jgi:hypothetical protein
MRPPKATKTLNPPQSPFAKGGRNISSLWQREVGRDFMEMISNRYIVTK